MFLEPDRCKLSLRMSWGVAVRERIGECSAEAEAAEGSREVVDAERTTRVAVASTGGASMAVEEACAWSCSRSKEEVETLDGGDEV